jgi:hypothetical protein
MTTERNPQRFTPGPRRRVNSSPRMSFINRAIDTVIAVPMSAERESLVDLCSDCGHVIRPVAVLRCPRDGDIAAYECYDCRSRWLSGWLALESTP